MGQTLLSVLALALLSVLAFSALQSRNEDISDRAMMLVRDEARGVSAGLMDRLGTMPFDDASPALTWPTDFGPPPSTDPTADLETLLSTDLGDLDDVHGLTRRIEVVLDHPVTGLDNPLVFETSLAVEYVEPTATGWATTADTTDQKRVSLHLVHEQTGVAVDFGRVYSNLSL